MLDLNTTEEAMHAIAIALEDRSIDDLHEIEEVVEDWLMTEDDQDAWVALFRATEDAIIALDS